MKVILNDFQILEGTHSFDFPSGINVIVGPNASGKSSLFYAIENCLVNPNGVSDCINYNKDKTSVTIEENNESITWIRTADSCCYLNNNTGQQFVKASKLDSRDIANLGFYFDTKGKVVNIHNEWSVLFPFAESDTDMFRLFEDIFNISSSFQIIDEMKKDEQNVKNEIVSIQKSKMEQEDRLGKLNNLLSQVDADKITNFNSLIDQLGAEFNTLSNDFNTYERHLELTTIEIPEGFDLFSLYEVDDKLNLIKKDYEIYLNNLNISLSNIPKVEINLDIENIDTIKHDYEQYVSIQNKIKEDLNQLNLLIEKETLIKEKISQIKICPTCGQKIGENQWKI